MNRGIFGTPEPSQHQIIEQDDLIEVNKNDLEDFIKQSASKERENRKLRIQLFVLLMSALMYSVYKAFLY